MKKYGIEVEQKWIDAGIGAMVGEFCLANVYAALIRADCPYWTDFGGYREYFAARVADAILRREKKAGRIRFDRKIGLWVRAA